MEYPPDDIVLQKRTTITVQAGHNSAPDYTEAIATLLYRPTIDDEGFKVQYPLHSIVIMVQRSTHRCKNS